MPELPEVEVACRAIAPHLQGKKITGATPRTPRLRQILDPQLALTLPSRTVLTVERRSKYLLIKCGPKVANPTETEGWLIIHLGMSGSLRLLPTGSPSQKHDHFDLIFEQQLLRLNDPRRFGLVLWHSGAPLETHPLFAHLGPEPLSGEIDGAWLHQQLARRSGPIKPALMNSHLLVGIGNIYASESLFRAGISPLRAANRISKKRCVRLLDEIRHTLNEAIIAGGSSLRDYVHTNGGKGGFQADHQVYERAGLPCLRCNKPIRQIRQAGRSSYYCPHCQR